MNYKKPLFLVCTLLIFTGCMNNDNNLSLEPDGDRSLELTKLSSGGEFHQQAANQAKGIISNYEEITGVRAVNYEDELLIAVDVDHLDRFVLDDIENEVKKNVKQNFAQMQITVSTDQKIYIELEDLEQALQANNISKDNFKKRFDKIKKLSKEET